MNRSKWEFPYAADKLLDAARAKHQHHTVRLKWWEDKKAETMEKVKAEGLEFDESLADKLSSAYNRQTTVQIREDLLRDLQECVGKIREHRDKTNDYDAWMQVLASQGSAAFVLHQEDWLFFFGKQ